MAIVFRAHRDFEGYRLLGRLLDLAHPLGAELELSRQFFIGRLTPDVLLEPPRDPRQLVDRLDHVHRDADGARLVGNRAGDRLSDPPRGVRAELIALAELELLDRPHQADVALLDQIQQRHTAADVLLGHRHDEPQIGFYQVASGAIGLIFNLDQRFVQCVWIGVCQEV